MWRVVILFDSCRVSLQVQGRECLQMKQCSCHQDLPVFSCCCWRSQRCPFGSSFCHSISIKGLSSAKAETGHSGGGGCQNQHQRHLRRPEHLWVSSSGSWRPLWIVCLVGQKGLPLSKSTMGLGSEFCVILCAARMCGS